MATINATGWAPDLRARRAGIAIAYGADAIIKLELRTFQGAQ
ncbi:hypothetical protein ABE485_04190 [Achromobacter spanius]